MDRICKIARNKNPEFFLGVCLNYILEHSELNSGSTLSFVHSLDFVLEASERPLLSFTFLCENMRNLLIVSLQSCQGGCCNLWHTGFCWYLALKAWPASLSLITTCQQFYVYIKTFCDSRRHTLKDVKQHVICRRFDRRHHLLHMYVFSLLWPSVHKLQNFWFNIVENLKHSLIDPFNWVRGSEQTLSFTAFQKC